MTKHIFCYLLFSGFSVSACKQGLVACTIKIKTGQSDNTGLVKNFSGKF